MLRSTTLATALLLGCASEPMAPPGGEAMLVLDSAPRDLIMISVDTLRRDHVGWLGESPSFTPALDARLDRAVVLTEHQSCANWTYASVMCALGGRSTVDMGVDPHVNPDKSTGPPPLPEHLDFLPGWLDEEGFDSALVAANQLLCPETGLGVGHDSVDCVGGQPAGRVVERALEAWDGLGAGSRRFLHVHFMDPHGPYVPPDEYLDGLDALDPIPWELTSDASTASAMAAYEELPPEEAAALRAHVELRYAGEVRFWDESLEDLFVGLEERGATEDALVILWSDHGEQIFERGYLGHGHSLHVEENAAIAALWAQGLEPMSWAAPTTHADLVPTLAHLMQLPARPVWSGEVLGHAAPSRPLFALQTHTTAAPRQALRVGNLKLLYRWDGPRGFYDLMADPQESEDLYDPEDPRVQELWEILRVEQLRVAALTDYEPVDVGP